MLVNHKDPCKLDIDPQHSTIVDNQLNVWMNYETHWEHNVQGIIQNMGYIVKAWFLKSQKIVDKVSIKYLDR